MDTHYPHDASKLQAEDSHYIDYRVDKLDRATHIIINQIAALQSGVEEPMILNWDLIERAARDRGKPVELGAGTDFSRREKGAMSKAANARGLNIRYGNSELDEDESNDKLYVMAKGVS